MNRKFTLRTLFMACLFLFTQQSYAQTWTLAGPDDANQPAYFYSYSSALASDKAGSFYTAYIGPDYKLAVRRWNGSWQQVGALAVSGGTTAFIGLAVGPGSVPYVVYKDYSNSSRRVVVRKFNGTAWADVGSPVSPGPGDCSRIAIDQQGNPVVAYVDSAASKKVTVKKWDGTAWQLIGAANFSSPNITGLRLAISSNNQPYVLAQSYNPGEVFRFNGSAWVSLGLGVPNYSVTDYMDLAVSRGDTAYVGYGDYANNNRLAVRKYDGASWVNVGNGGISPTAVSQVQLLIDSLNGPYVYCTSSSASSTYQNYFPMVRHFNGNYWEVVGPDSFVVNHDASGSSAIALDTDRTIHLLYGDAAYQSKSQLLKLNNGQWTTLGTSKGLSQGQSANAKVVATPDGKKAYLMTGSNYYGDYSSCRVLEYNNGWTTMGQSGASGWTGEPLDIAVDPAGHPWIAVRDSVHPSVFTVWRHTGSSWVYTGLQDTVGYTGASITIDGGGNVYVSCRMDGSVNYFGGAMVYKYTNGSGWTPLTVTGVGNATFDWSTIRVSSTGEPWLMGGGVISNSPNYLYYMLVYRYTGGNWVQVGGTINSANGTRNWGPADFALDSFDVPYIVYPNSATAAVKLKKFNSVTNQWDDVTAANGLTGCWYPNLQFAPNGKLYLSYTDVNTTSYWRATTLQLNGSAFQAVGSTQYTATTSYAPRTAVLNNRLLTSFFDGAAYAYKYDCPTPANITMQPTDLIICAGSNTRIPVNATGATSYRWQANNGSGWKNIASSSLYSAVSDDTLLLSAVPLAVSGTQYRCVLTNGCGGAVISNGVTLLVDTTGLPAPGISITTNNTTACAGQPVTFTATAVNAGVSNAYEWAINGTPVAGATASTFTTTALNQGDMVTGRITRLSACGQAPVTATSNAVTMSIITTLPPSVTIAAVPGTSIYEGTAVTFTATVTNGGTAPQYQWLRNGSNINGQTAATYTSSSLANGDVISVRVGRSDTCAGTAAVTSTGLTMQVASSVSNLASSYGIELYPQPAKDALYLSGAAGAPAGDYMLGLYLVTGQTILQKAVKLDGNAWTDKISIPATVPAGLYRLSLRGAVQLASGSVVIVR